MKKDAGDRKAVVLLVDDDDAVRKLLAGWLQTAGYTVLDAASGAEAILLHTARCDIALLVTDIVMPEMDGFALSERLTEKDPNLKIVYMTGYCRAANNMLPGSVWMRKPLRREEFVREVRQLLAPNTDSARV